MSGIEASAQAYKLSVENTTQTLLNAVQEKVQQAQEGDDWDLRSRSETELFKLATGLVDTNQQEIIKAIKEDLHPDESAPPLPPEEVRAEEESLQKISEIIRDSRNELAKTLAESLIPVQQKQLAEKKVQVETKEALTGLKEKVNTVFLQTLEQKNPKAYEKIKNNHLVEPLGPEGGKVIKDANSLNQKFKNVPREERPKAMQNWVEEQYQEQWAFIKPVEDGLLDKSIKLDNPLGDYILALAKKNTISLQDIQGNRFAMQLMEDTIKRAPERFQKNAQTLQRAEQEREKGKTDVDIAMGQKKAFTDIAFTKIVVSLREKIFSNPELKVAYDAETNEAVHHTQDVHIDLAAASKNHNAFTKLLEKKDGIVHFLIFYLMPLWAYTVAGANLAVFLQDRENTGALMYAAGGIGLGHFLNTKDYLFGPDSMPHNLFNKIQKDPESKTLFNELLQGESGKEEATLIENINWKDARPNDFKTGPKDNKAWGKAQLEQIGKNENVVEKSNQPEFNTALNALEARKEGLTSTHENEQRCRLYKKLLSYHLNLHEVRQLTSYFAHAPH